MPGTPGPALAMSSTKRARREPKASRARVWQAVEQIVHAGRRPTVEGVRELLGGGSPNSVTAYINEWYQELGSRLTSADGEFPGVPSEAIGLLAELWRVAARPRSGAIDASDALKDAERAALAAEIKALETLNKELEKIRASATKSAADTRALLLRSEAAREAAFAQITDLEAEIAHLRLELEIARERDRLKADRPVGARAGRRRAPRRTPIATARRAKAKAKVSRKPAPRRGRRASRGRRR